MEKKFLRALRFIALAVLGSIIFWKLVDVQDWQLKFAIGLFYIIYFFPKSKPEPKQPVRKLAPDYKNRK